MNTRKLSAFAGKYKYVLIILLAGQTLLIFLFTYFVIFNIMGRDYDAAVIAAPCAAAAADQRRRSGAGAAVVPLLGGAGAGDG